MAAALELSHISKSFGTIAANKDISLSIAAGSIHAIVGENGAGKSTLMSILFGELQPDSGEIRASGLRVQFASPRDAIASGVGMVHQHFMLIEAMSVLDNLLLGAEGGAWLSRGRAAMRAKLAALERGYGLGVDPDALASELSVGARQRVALARALTRSARILILDEPTAVLTPGETNELFAWMRRLRDSGASVIFITHKLGEALEVSDCISVLRRGALVAQFDPAIADVTDIAAAMIGRRPAPPQAESHAMAGAAVFSARGICVSGAQGGRLVDGVSLDLREGEIVAIAGVSGNGQTPLLEALAGMRRPTHGALSIGGEVLPWREINPRTLRARGVRHVPEDRLLHGLIADFPACESAMLGCQNEARYGASLLSPSAIRTDCESKMRGWDVRPNDPSLQTRRFSGGNQQKLILAREIERGPRVLLVGQPTRGVDIGAIEAIHARLRALRDSRTAILLVSSELDEIMSLADRILVMFRGRIIGERAPRETSAGELGALMAGMSGAAQ